MKSLLGPAAMALAARFKGGGLIVNEHRLTPDQLRVHVDALGRWFDFIHPDELPGRLLKRGKKPFCLLTFDDGNRSDATVTAPALERLGIPACFLVVTEFIGAKTALWFELYNLLREKLGILPPGLSPRAVKQLPYDLLTERIARACRRHGISADLEDDDVASMTWDHVRDLRRRGFALGSHGVTHAILTRETREDALSSISRSIERIRAETSAPCAAFAFPNGNYTAELALHAARAGARLVMTTEPTWADQRFPLWRLPRLQLFPKQDRATVELKVAVSALGVVLKSGDGTGMVYREINRLSRARSGERAQVGEEKREAASSREPQISDEPVLE
jgi:peptidoglycan/xylan/chitin deacetylase (PgdA/CDA1 family)